MKKIKLFLAAMAAMFTMGANAQSWTASEVGAGQFVLYNVGTGQYFTRGNGYGTQASITADASPSSALTITLEAVGTDFKLRTDVNGTGYGVEHLSGGTIYTDQSRNSKNSAWTFTEVAQDNGPVYTIISAGTDHGGGAGVYMTASGSNTIVGPGTDGTSAYAKWKLLEAAKVPLVAAIGDYQAVRTTIVGWTTSSAVTNADAAKATFNTALAAADDKVASATTTAEIEEAIADLKAAGNTFLENVTIEAGLDITNAWITNPTPYANGNGWTAVNGTRINDWASNPVNYNSGNQCAEMWSNQGATFKQALAKLPAGAYKLTAVAYTRTGMVSTLSAGDASINLVTVASSIVDNLNQAKTWFDNGNGINNLSFTLNEAAETLEIGLTTGTSGDAWTVWRSFSLTYYGNPINLAKAALAEAVAAAQAVDGIPTAAKAELDAVVTANNQTWSTEAEYDAAVSAINTAVSTYASAQIVAAYVTVINAKALYNQTDYTDKDNAKATFKALIDAADATTNLTDLNAAIVDLKAGLTPFISTVTLNENAFFDVTNFFVVNPSVSQNTTGWTIEGTPNGGYSWAVCNYGECEFYQQNFKFYQTLALTPGTWEFGVTGFHRAGSHNTHFYAGDDKILIPGVANTVVNTMAEAQTYFNNGNGKVALKFLVETAGNIEIGIDNQDTETDKWTIFRDFTLKYYGAPNYSIYEQQWADAVTAANAAKADAANVNVTGSELTALDAAIADSPIGSNLKATYTAKINALEDATQAFIAAAPSYDKYAAYKAETVTLFGSDLGVAAPTSAAEASAAVQNLNIAQYNKVADDYKFSLTSKIGDFSTWTGTAEVGTPRVAGTPNSLNWEHWSGIEHPYYEQDGNGYGNAGGWTIQYTKTTTLPAGSYVVKVAARSSAGVTSKVTCTALPGVEISLPCAGNNTRGINTDGEASWDEYDIFISTGGKNPTVGGTGAGWQWRFLPFSLSAETEVTMTFYAEASTGAQWMSIADGELLSVDNVATAVAYNDATTNTIADVDLANVTISRTIKEGFNTVVVPFDLTLGQMEAAFGTGAEVYAFSENSADPAHAVINFNKVGAGTISANVPVLIKATEASSAQTFNGVEVVAPTGDAKVEGTNFDFIGIYAPATVEALDYFIADGAIYKSAGSTNLKAFRAYIYNKDKSANNAVKMFIEDGGVLTAIDSINGIATENGPVFNLAGQRVNKAQKGIYIQNSKKVLVK